MAGPLPFPVFVSGASARTALGLTARQTAMCVRARKGEPRSTRFKDKRGYFIGACTVPGVPDQLEGIARLEALAVPALRAAAPREAISRLPAPAGAIEVTWPVLLAVPERGRPDDDERLDGAIVVEIARAAGVALDEGKSKTFREGHAGFAAALAAAVELLSRGTSSVIVGAVDSYFHGGLLTWLDQEHRIHALDVENGFVPGEGCAFLTLSREPGVVLGAQSVSERGGRDPQKALREAPARPPGKARSEASGADRVRLRAVETAVEVTVDTDAPNTALATTRLLAALAPLCAGEKIGWALTDVNGERHRLREWNRAVMRGSLVEKPVVETLVDELGDMGAASGGILAAVAHELFVTGAAPAESVCIALASDSSARGAFLLGLEGAAT